jgi:hypothetical protein
MFGRGRHLSILPMCYSLIHGITSLNPIDKLNFMLTFSQALILALVALGVLPPPFVVLVPLVYIWIIGRGLIKGGANIRVEELAEILSERWKNPQELAEYMKRYWCALDYSSSATTRQHTCTSLALLQILSGVAIFWKASIAYGLLALVEGGVLWVMATRVNRPLSMYKDVKVRTSSSPFCRREWRLGVSSLIAYAQIYPANGNATFIASRLLSDELVQHEIAATQA